MSILIKGGTVISATGAHPADVLVDGERIVATAAPDAGLSESWAGQADTVIDAAGKYVLPGGIDVHTHLQLPVGETESSDEMFGKVMSISDELMYRWYELLTDEGAEGAVGGGAAPKTARPTRGT